MRPIPDSTTQEIDKSKCVLWGETKTLNYLSYSLKHEMGYNFTVHKVTGNLCFSVATIWEAKYAPLPMNYRNMVVLEFETAEGAEFLAHLNPRVATMFESIDDIVQPGPVALRLRRRV